MHLASQTVLNRTIGIFGKDLRGNHMFDYRVCLAAMLYVQQNINTPMYNYLSVNDKELFDKLSGRHYDPLSREIGICGHHIQAFLLLMRELEYEARDV